MDEDIAVAAAAFILLITAIFAYVLSLILPRRHYPRFFALIIGLATAPFFAILKVPGALEACYFLLFSTIFTFWPLWLFDKERVWNWFFKLPEVDNAVSTPSAREPRSRSLILGLLLGVIVGGFLVSAFTGGKETLDETGTLPQGGARNVYIKVGSGLRVADGAMYLGVSDTHYGSSCDVSLNSDKADGIKKERMVAGEAIAVPSSQGRYRVVLTGLKSGGCLFDIVKDGIPASP
ncbi:MAG: hypothetical protein WAN43_00355 [Rhodomicrobium sp.]